VSPAEAATDRGRPPGRPRSRAADEAILGAALELLVESGYRALSMEAVRSRAGVGKATLYRRFATKRDLVDAALDLLGTAVEPPADTGTLRGDFEALITEMAQTVYTPGMAAFMPRLMAESVADDDLHELFYKRLVVPRRQVVLELVARAVARGEIRDDLDPEVVVDLLAGPLVYRVIISGGRPEKFARGPLTAFDAAYAGIATR
jgi:AcrR family transcriptional regulator